MKKVLLAFILLTGLLQTSCSSDLISESLPITNSVDVYVAGKKNNQACYWKNNQLVALAQGNFTNSYTRKILVANNDVHILGYASDKSLYWKNGVLTDLSSTFSDTSQVVKGITDMEVIGSDVYFVGFTKNPLIAAEIYDLAYWKNGVKTVIAQNINNIPQAFIAVANDKIYIASQSNTADPVYYVNGVSHSLPSPTDIAGITTSGNAVYVYGSNTLEGFYFDITTNTNTSVSFSNGNGITNICVDNDNLYYTNGAAIYKNGTILYPEISSHIISDFKVLNDNLYIINYVFGSTSGGNLIINNVITMTADTGESFNSISVVQN